jgi:hypothetical protein
LVEDWAMDIIRRLDTYTEVSPSGTGIRMFLRGALPGTGRKKGKIEVYDQGRYLTVTGHSIEDGNRMRPIKEADRAFDDFFAKTFGEDGKEVSKPLPPVAPSPGDDLVLDRLRNGKGKDAFQKLWTGNWSDYSSQSEADLALCNMIGNEARGDDGCIDRLFRRSGLYRDKWDERHGGETYGEKTVRKAAEGCREFLATRVKSARITLPPMPVGITAPELMQMKFEDCKWVIPQVLTAGLAVLAGNPKLGKSWLVLNLAIALAAGGRALGKIPVEKAAVLYLGLEDKEWRLQRRLRPCCQGGPVPADLHFFTKWPRLDEGGLEHLDNWLKDHPGTGLVVIDTLARLWPSGNGKRSSTTLYHQDYESMTSVKEIADRHGTTILGVHHLRKQATEDRLAQLSGSMGISGSADTIMIMSRGRGTADATLLVTGRDVEEQELALQFDQSVKTWILLGLAQEVAKSRERQVILDALKEAHPKELRPSEIAKATGGTGANIRKLLPKLVQEGHVRKTGYGTYSFIPQVGGSSPGDIENDHSVHTGGGDLSGQTDHTPEQAAHSLGGTPSVTEGDTPPPVDHTSEVRRGNALAESVTSVTAVTTPPDVGGIEGSSDLVLTFKVGSEHRTFTWAQLVQEVPLLISADGDSDSSVWADEYDDGDFDHESPEFEGDQAAS